MSKQSLINLKDVFPGVIDDFFTPWSDWFRRNNFFNHDTVPALNVSDEKDRYKITVAAPGLEKSDFDVDVDDNVLTISASSEKEHEENSKLLLINGLRNISSHNNYCFEIPKQDDEKSLKEFTIFIPSIINKINNLRTIYPITKEKMPEILKKPTFIGISHAAAYVRYLELKSKLNIQAIRMPAVHLVNIYERSVSQATDENHLLIKHSVNFKPVNINNIHHTTFKDLLCLVNYLPISKISAENLQEDDAGFIYFNPSEDDFLHTPNTFFFTDINQIKRSAVAGLTSIALLVKDNSEKTKILHDFLTKNGIELDYNDSSRLAP